MSAKQRVRSLLDALIEEGEAVLATKWHQDGNWIGPIPTYVDLAKFSQLRAKCKLLPGLLGIVGKPWESELNSEKGGNKIETATNLLGVLKAIREAIDAGLLFRVEDLVTADVFANLLEQAEYLLAQGFYLAAGVLLRAVLEERLRRLCDEHSISLSKPRPTLNDFNTELYKASVYDKITFKDIDTLGAIGNEAAHNVPTLTSDKVVQLRDGVVRILQKFST